MIVYHGSSLVIPEPDVQHSRDNVDFGKGFYTTPIKEQAIKWSERFKSRAGQGVLSIYELDLKACKDDYSESADLPAKPRGY